MMAPPITKLQGIVLFVTVMFAFSVVAYRTEVQQNTQDILLARSIANQELIRINQLKIAEDTNTQCVDRNTAASDINAVLDALIKGSETWTTQIQADRLALWRSAKVTIVPCEKAVIK